eukprot:m.110395 g.110395  ORF g.110395 m.110395 type:complete len:59 (+) comp12745_c0_seq2:2402-2578(+)
MAMHFVEELKDHDNVRWEFVHHEGVDTHSNTNCTSCKYQAHTGTIRFSLFRHLLLQPR